MQEASAPAVPVDPTPATLSKVRILNPSYLTNSFMPELQYELMEVLVRKFQKDWTGSHEEMTLTLSMGNCKGDMTLIIPEVMKIHVQPKLRNCSELYNGMRESRFAQRIHCNGNCQSTLNPVQSLKETRFHLCESRSYFNTGTRGEKIFGSSHLHVVCLCPGQ